MLSISSLWGSQKNSWWAENFPSLLQPIASHTLGEPSAVVAGCAAHETTRVYMFSSKPGFTTECVDQNESGNVHVREGLCIKLSMRRNEFRQL